MRARAPAWGDVGKH
jgi:hypothetical protein